jgi:hypothetical protein
MPKLYVASSKSLQDWGSDVGLGKHVYKVGCVQEGEPAEAVENMAGFSDWKILLSVETDQNEPTILERLAIKEKMVDPNYYPRLRGMLGIVKIALPSVENAMLVTIALDNREPPKGMKVKPVDIANYLVRNLIK